MTWFCSIPPCSTSRPSSAGSWGTASRPQSANKSWRLVGNSLWLQMVCQDVPELTIDTDKIWQNDSEANFSVFEKAKQLCWSSAMFSYGFGQQEAWDRSSQSAARHCQPRELWELDLNVQQKQPRNHQFMRFDSFNHIFNLCVACEPIIWENKQQKRAFGRISITIPPGHKHKPRDPYPKILSSKVNQSYHFERFDNFEIMQSTFWSQELRSMASISPTQHRSGLWGRLSRLFLSRLSRHQNQRIFSSDSKLQTDIYSYYVLGDADIHNRADVAFFDGWVCFGGCGGVGWGNNNPTACSTTWSSTACLDEFATTLLHLNLHVYCTWIGCWATWAAWSSLACLHEFDATLLVPADWQVPFEKVSSHTNENKARFCNQGKTAG